MGLGQQYGTGTVFGCKARGNAFEGAAQLDRIIDITFGEGLDGIAAPHDLIQQAFLGQPLQGGTHGRARHAQAFHHCQF